MKIKRFNITNTKVQRIGKPTILISTNGRLTFSKMAKEKLNLNVGDKVEFIQDQEHPKDWYITKSLKGFDLKKSSSKYGGLVFYTIVLSKEFLKSVNKSKSKSVSCLLATESTNIDGEIMYAILTNSII